jgi:hypothetical protein
MGNTTMSRTACWTVKVLEIDHVSGRAMASWNGNAPKRYYRRDLERLRRSPPKKKDQ